MPLQPVKRRSVSDAVFDQLSDEIVAGRLGPGESLPAERALTELLQVNRQAVREALKRLGEAGLIEISHGGSTRVRDFRRNASLALLPRLMLRPDGTVDPATVRSVMEMRAALGPDVARRAAERATGEQAASLGAVVERMATAGGDPAALVQLDLQFWDELVDASDNVAYRLAFNTLRHTYEPVADVLAGAMAGELGDLRNHRTIADAVGDADADAAERAARRLLVKGTAAITALVADLEEDR
jgi:GntR family transcriptional regulator, transcriptional repressor for pyruvate dehydrogenase complex